jgi:prolyl oligopeptidase
MIRRITAPLSFLAVLASGVSVPALADHHQTSTTQSDDMADPAYMNPDVDPYLWLEEIEGEKALEWVEKENARTDAILKNAPTFEADRARAKAILDDDRQIAMPGQVMGDRIANLWRDAEHPRGLWRTSPLDAYLAGKPEWTTLIDVDALGKAEGKSWVWHGADCLAPEYTRCLVSLSPGGTDADVVREFDTGTGSFINTGFYIPEAKTNVAWYDANTLMVGTDWEGENSLTESGYPRVVKLWRRGSPLTSADTVAEGETTDVSMAPVSMLDGDTRWKMIFRAKDFYTTDFLIGTADGDFIPTPIPDTADIRAVLKGKAIVFLNDDAGAFKAGSLIAYSLADMAAGKATKPTLVMQPTASQAIEEVDASDNVLWVKALDDVDGTMFKLAPKKDGSWTQEKIALVDNATVHLEGMAGAQDIAFVTAESMLSPPTLYAISADGNTQAVQSLPELFDDSQFTAEKRFATSKDGTRIPYFLVRKKGAEGTVPALIHAYGGFRNAQTPTYLTQQPYRAGPLGLFWVEDGNAYVLANIRGGGEYGPAWHEAALREKRQNSFDDLHAVAEDLVATGITDKGRIAISGRSNGGVLVGAAMTQRPDLYGAVISGSPLHDMYRYDKLLAGASWVAEYGDPDNPDDWAFMKKYSPYQNVNPDVVYPDTFFYLSTKDDRVHPGHARKFAAKLMATGTPVYYHEYREGGHSVGADHAEDAVRAAMLHAFLKRVLMGEGEAQ